MATSYIKNMNEQHMQNALPSITWSQLRKAGRTLPVPFQLLLKDSDIPLICEEVVRVIPSKRLVMFGLWDDQPVVAKLFIEYRNAKRHLKRDVDGIDALIESNIPTPALLYKGVAREKRIHVLIFERILKSHNLEDVWQQKTSMEEMTPLLRHVSIELATQHVLGIVQRDLHLKNFLITQKKIYTLDGGSIERENAILSKEDSLQHLGLFFAQLGVGTDSLLQDLLDVYAKARGWIVKTADVEFLRKSIEKWNSLRWDRYQKKIFRHCSAYMAMETTHSFVMYDREYDSPEFLALLKNPDIIFAHPDTVMLKNGGSSTVVKIKINNKVLVIKRYNIKSAGHWLRRCLRRSRAAMSWRMAHRLQLFGVATAKPVAFIENRILGLRGKSYLIMEHVEGPSLGNYFTQVRDDNTLMTKMVDRVIILLKNLALMRITHGDLKMTNILIDHNNPVLIDLDGMVEHKTFFSLKRAWSQEIKRFMKNWENTPSVRVLFERISK